MIGGFLIPAPYKFAGAVIVVFAVFGYGYIKGAASKADDLAACESTVETIRKVQYDLEAKTAAIRLESEKIVKETADGWAAAVAWHRAHPRIIRVRTGNDCSSSSYMPAVSAPPVGADATTAQPGLGATGAFAEISIEELNRRLDNAERDAAQVMHLIEFVRQQHEASKYAK